MDFAAVEVFCVKIQMLNDVEHHKGADCTSTNPGVMSAMVWISASPGRLFLEYSPSKS